MPPADRRRAWLRFPPATIRRPLSCPSGLPRFANVDRARQALMHGLSLATWTVTACKTCGGAHHTRVGAPEGSSGRPGAVEGPPGAADTATRR
jgi:hypothetical protein